MLLAAGVIVILLVIIIFLMPDVLFVYLPLILGFWLMFRGYTMLDNSSDMLGYGIKGSGWTLAFGILVVATSFFMLAVPFTGLGSYAVWLGLALLFAAAGTVFYAIHLSRLRKYLV